MTAIVGRVPELTSLRAAVSHGAAGRPRSVVIEGEVGIGKTTLLDAVADLARGDGISIARGAAVELEADRPFGPLISALDLTSRSRDSARRLVGEIITGSAVISNGPGVTTTDDRHRGVDAVHGLLDDWCSTHPSALLLDDLHWADESTLLTIRRLSRSPGMPLLMVLTSRPPDEGSLVAQVLESIVAAGGVRLRLGPLGRSEVRTLVADLVGGPPGPRLIGLADGAGGNPLFLAELVTVLRQDGSLRAGEHGVEVADGAGTADLARRLRARAARLGSSAAALVRVGAVLGGSFTLDEAARTGGWPLADLLAPLDELLHAGLLVDAGGVLMFRHDLLRRAIEDELPPTARRALHSAAGHALVDTGASPVRIARHLAFAAEPGDPEAVRWLQRAAREAAVRSPAGALDLLDKALVLVGADDPARIELLTDRVEALGWSGRNAEAELLAKQLLEGLDDREARLALRRQLSLALVAGNRATEAVEQCRLSADESLDMPAVRAGALAEAALASIAAEQPERAAAFADEALALGRRHAAPIAVSQALSVQSRLLALEGRGDDALAVAEEADAVAGDDREAKRRQPGFFVAMCLLDLERDDELRTVLRRERLRAEDLGTTWVLPFHHALAANRHLLLAELADAATEATTGLTVAEDSGAVLPRLWLHAVLANVAMHRGDLAGAEMHVRLGDEAVATTTPLLGSDLHVRAQARLVEARRDPKEAAAIAIGAFDLYASRGVIAAHRIVGMDALRLAHLVGDALAVDRVTNGLTHLAQLAAVPSDRATAAFASALRAGDADTMVAVAGESASGCQPLRRAAMGELAAQLLWSLGRRDDAGAALSVARRIFVAAGADGDARRTADLLATLGLRHTVAADRPTTGWDALTPSEHRVAEMVSTGAGNAAIATHLGVSRRTVETHLRHIYAKLGVASRVDVALTAARHAP